MEFYTSFNEKRPVRLSEKTRQFAYDSLHAVYGQDTLRNMCVSEECPNASDLNDRELYNRSIELIAREAPIRICENELISGAATLGYGIQHSTPASIGGWRMVSISHLTVDFFEVVRHGYSEIEKKIIKYKELNTDKSKDGFYESMLRHIKSFDVYRERYVEALRDKPGYERNYKALQRVPKYGAESFYEAVQSLWFAFSFIRLCGCWPGIGRIDVLLGDYLKKGLENGTVTLDEAREILAHFFIKGCEWITGLNTFGGDAQHYQNIILSGIDENGNDVTNEVSYLVLDIVEETGISDFPITIRLGEKTPREFLRRAAEVIRYGGGIIAVYNEALILDALTKFGYPYSDAVKFANDGCWEVQIPGCTYFGYIPFDGLAVLQNDALDGYNKTDFPDYESLYNTFIEKLNEKVEGFERERIDDYYNVVNRAESAHVSIVSLFENGCIENGRGYNSFGAKYAVRSPHIGGLADCVNTLYAIKKLVFDDKLLTLPQLFEILRSNWEGNEPLRQYAKSHYIYFGNDNDEVDGIYARLVHDFAEGCKACDGKSPLMFPAGVSTFGRQLSWAKDRLATPFGRFSGDVLAANTSPTPGTDKNGVTSVIKSYGKADLRETVNGAALDIQLLCDNIKSEAGITVLEALLKGFVTCGGFFMQIDTADAELLRRAQKDPEQYDSLSVRVSGWNARFATLDKRWQDMIINRYSDS